MLHKKLFEKFVKEKLRIENFDLKFYWVWKDNITCLLRYDKWDFVIQLNKNISDIQMQIIDEVIDYWNKNWITLAWKKFNNRFYEFESKVFHVMNVLSWKLFEYEEFNIWELKKITSYIAQMHNIFEEWDFSKFKDWTNNFKNLFYFLELAKEFNEKDDKYQDYFKKIIEYSKWLWPIDGLRKWVIHWDAILRNFLFDESKNISWLIDYEMISYEDFLWDFVDHIRFYMKYDNFWKIEYEKLKNAYTKIRPFTNLEEKNIKNYLKMIILNTTTRYFLVLFEDSWFNNLNWWTVIWKINRCFWELEKVDSLFD